MTGIPAPVLEAIATRTGVDPRGIGRHAQLGACRRCSAPVLRGLDADMCAFTAEADPTPLTAVGEVLALAASRPTYTLHGRPPVLTVRSRHHISRYPANKNTVLPEHQCHAPALPTRIIPEYPAPERKADARIPY